MYINGVKNITTYINVFIKNFFFNLAAYDW